MGRGIAAALALAVAASTPAGAASSAWVEAGDARLRLHLVAGEGTGEAARGAAPSLLAGVEVSMAPGWHTYWRTPGDVGFPPRFDFSASENVARAEVLFPLPERLEEKGAVSLIYPDTAVFPVKVEPADPEKPVTLRVQAEIGVCREICVPVFATLDVSRAPGAETGVETGARFALRSALRRVPADASADAVFANPPEREGETLRLSIRAPAGPVDLFAEGPEGWFLGQPRLAARGSDTATFTLDLKGRPMDAPLAGAPLRLTVSGAGGAKETAIALP